MRAARLLITLIAVLLVTLPLTLMAAPLPKLAGPPLGERWFSVNAGGERVGFAHLTITRENDGYRILSGGSVKMRIMGVSREATSKESYLVGPDLSLKSFAVSQYLEGKLLQVKGEVIPKGIRVTEDREGRKKERTIRTKVTIFPPQALNIYPLMHDADKGKKYRISMLDPETVKVKEIKVEVIGRETLPPGTPVLHLQNNLFPVVDNDIWVDLQGNTVKESVRDDLVLTLAEDELTAKNHLAEDALAKKEQILPYSLIRTEPIQDPGGLKKLVLEVTGIPATFTVKEGDRQSAERAKDLVRFTTPSPAAASAQGPAPADTQATASIPSDAPELAALQRTIVGDAKDPSEAVRRLVSWVAKEVKGNDTETVPALVALQKRSGNAQSHARIYTALARSAGIPTRFVSGIVFLPKQGFLYHSWGESYLGESWVPVDPTYGEDPANLTHVKLVEGDTAEDMAVLGSLVGRLSARVVEQGY